MMARSTDASRLSSEPRRRRVAGRELDVVRVVSVRERPGQRCRHRGMMAEARHRINGGCSSCRHAVTPAGGYAVGCAEASARSIDVSQVSLSVSPSTLIVVVTASAGRALLKAKDSVLEPGDKKEVLKHGDGHSGSDGRCHDVVLKVEEVIGKAGVGATEVSHVVLLAMSLCLARRGVGRSVRSLATGRCPVRAEAHRASPAGSRVRALLLLRRLSPRPGCRTGRSSPSRGPTGAARAEAA